MRRRIPCVRPCQPFDGRGRWQRRQKLEIGARRYTDHGHCHRRCERRNAAGAPRKRLKSRRELGWLRAGSLFGLAALRRLRGSAPHQGHGNIAYRLIGSLLRGRRRRERRGRPQIQGLPIVHAFAPGEGPAGKSHAMESYQLLGMQLEVDVPRRRGRRCIEWAFVLRARYFSVARTKPIGSGVRTHLGLRFRKAR